MFMCEVQHQPRAHRVIQRALTSQRMPHAYLFAGPEGVGKEMMAVGLAQTMLCTKGTGNREQGTPKSQQRSERPEEERGKHE